MTSLKTGDKVPDFELYDQNKNLFRLKDHLGKNKLVIYFYPKDDTPGCTAEACSFRDSFEEFTDRGAIVVGISSDDIQTHKDFAQKHQLPFLLLSDPENMVRKKFNVPRSMFGLLPGRVTFIVDENGTILHLFNSQFKTSQHVEEALTMINK
jgi:peroxiredoxin Q/BCP